MEVVEPPQGMTPPNQNLAKKTNHQPNKLRKFVAKNSAGLRVRAHPSLQSEQIGIVHVNGTIAFIDEVSDNLLNSHLLLLVNIFCLSDPQRRWGLVEVISRHHQAVL